MLQFYFRNATEQMNNLLFALIIVLSLAPLARLHADEPRVLATVHPLTLMAASLVDNPQTLIPGNVTPHDFAFRPSDMRRLQQAEIVIWSGAANEPYMPRLIKRWPQKHWIDVSVFADPHAGHTHTPGQQDDTHHQDGHWWFDPQVMLKAQQQLAAILGLSPEPFRQQVMEQLQRSEQLLRPLRQQGFFVFHQAYDRWVDYFDLNQLGAFTISPQQKPGLRTLNAMRQQLEQHQLSCVFTEPQFSSALVSSVIGELPVKTVELDPLGRHISVTKQGYAEFLNDLTQRFVRCLTPPQH